MMIYIFDNGEDYSDHAIYFVSTEGYDPQDAEKILRQRYQFVDEGDARSHDHSFLVATVEEVAWYAGQPQKLHNIYHWRFLNEDFFKSLLPSTQRMLYRNWRSELAAEIRRRMKARDQHPQKKRARRMWSEDNQFGGRRWALTEIEKLEKVGKLLKKELCQSCGVNEATDPHECPFQSDVNNDSDTLCNCCAECEHNCLMDI